MESCFLSPVAYVTMVLFLAASGGTFMIAVLRNEGGTEPLPLLLFSAVILWLTLLVTVVSMRLFAEEQRSGTIETLMTAPVTDTQVVLGKFGGALSFLLIVALPALGYMYVLAALSPSLARPGPGPVIGGCVVLVLACAFCTSVGLLVSLFTRNQIVAAVCCFTAIWVSLLAGDLLDLLPAVPRQVADVLSATAHIEDFSRGMLDTRPVVFLLSVTALALFAAVKVLESRRWR